MTLAEKLTQVAENVPKVHEAGKKAQYDEFWASAESSIKARGYAYAFAGKAWTADTFKPTFDLAPTTSVNKPTASADSMFYASNIPNIKQSLEDCGVKLDLSKATSATTAFNVTVTTALPEIDLRNCTEHSSVFAWSSSLVSIDKVYFAKNVVVTNSFQGCGKLKHVIFGGTFASTGLNLQWSNLDTESLTSLVDALANKSGDTSGTKWEITLGETNVAKLTESQKASIEAKGWSYK
jgi:hypothetical protein